MWDNLFIKHFHRYNFKKVTKRNKFLNQGNFGIKILEGGLLSPQELKAIYFFLRKNLKKRGKIWLNLNPNFTKTKKPIETRMGKGKGNIEGLYCNVKKGQIIVEVNSFSDQFSLEILKEVKKKISLKSKIVKNII